MKILSASQIREADQYTIQHEPIASIDLMERASERFVEWFASHFDVTKHIKVFCGTGNNGGDGLAISRMLKNQGYEVMVYVVRQSDNQSDDFTVNLKRLEDRIDVREISTEKQMPAINSDEIVIDGLFGSGLSRIVSGLHGYVIYRINGAHATVVSIDIPSGMFCDEEHDKGPVVMANYTVSFQSPKPAFFLQGNLEYVSNWQVVDIGLDKEFITKADTSSFAVTSEYAAQLIKPRKINDHKGSNGRAMLIAGSYGKMGAAVLASKAAMRSGLGLLTVHSPHCGYNVLQTSVPEAMVSPDSTEFFFGELPVLDKFDAIGIGPGLDTKAKTIKAYEELLQQWDKPMVIDADALNILADNRQLLELLPANSILTPHRGEFERLVGEWKDDLERLELQKEFSKRYSVITVVKGPATAIASPESQMYFNTTGNPGMATAGSGDVLTGMITSLLAQGYTPIHAAIVGCHLHGMAGDLASEEVGMHSLIASDIVDFIPDAYLNLWHA